MVTTQQKGAAGFSLIELMITMAVSVAVLGAAATLSSRVQGTYQYQLHDVTVEQEARYALDWISRDLTPAGTNPYFSITGLTTTDCPAAGTALQPLWLDPNGNGVNDDVRIQADVGSGLNAPAGLSQPRIPNGLILGAAGACNEPNEDVTIAHDAANSVITRFDRATDVATGPVAMSEAIFTSLRFTYLDANLVVTAVSANVRTVRIAVQGQSRGRNPYTGQFTTFALQQDVRLRTQ
jgi:prepilin-type N-terminal cleavage/methylation domain-containing protein